MKCFLLLLAFWTQMIFARVDFETSNDKFKEKREFNFLPGGFYSFEIGVARTFFLDKKVREAYEKQYSRLLFMPIVRTARFINVGPLALGLGLQFSYLKGSGKTLDDDGKEAKEEEILVYIPYQVFLDVNFKMINSFLAFDVWFGYEEAFIENRRECAEACDTDSQVYITEKGKHWNSYGVVGASLGFSLKGLGRQKSFTDKSPLGTRDLFLKIFYERDFNLKAKKLLGNRLITKTFKLAKQNVGMTFSFEL